ncbi:hypothetical protein [Marinobacter salexigens]|uniref:hypothetical protein n=1 Tax=Marinobacter salexigens TaxID=1925763 RepID=UPI000C290A05|nr:hypothetical protein [Marinobacter salexigens]
MLRAIFFLGVISGLMAVIVFGARWLQTSEYRGTADSQAACDLLSGPCEWSTKTGSWKISLHVMGDKGQGTEYQLIVDTPAPQERFLAVLRGESMYMGEYPVPMRQGEGNQYTAQFTAPLCTTGDQMIWRIDLQEGQQRLPEPAPLKLVFQARVQ